MTTSGLLDKTPAGPAGRRPGWWTVRRLRWAGLATGIGVVAAAVLAYLVWVSPTSPDRAQVAAAETDPVVVWGRPTVSAAGLAARSGVKLVHVASTGGGGLLDLRYQVVDPNAAATLHNPETPPALIDEKSGLVVHELFMDHAHKGAFHAGESYYYILINPRNHLQRGSLVTVLLGDAAVQHVRVQ